MGVGRAAWMLMAVLAVVAVTVCAFAFGWTVSFDWWPQAFAVGVAAVLAVLYFRWQYQARTAEAVESGNGLDSPEPWWSLVEELCPASLDAPRSADAFTVEDSLVFVRAMSFPRSMFVRISEYVEPYHRSLFVRTTYGASLSGDRDVVVPLLVIPKGEVLYGLRVTGPDGRRISTLDSRRQVAVTLANIRVVVSTLSDDALTQYCSTDLERRVAAAVCAKHPPTEPELAELLAAVEALPTDGGNDIIQAALTGFITNAVQHQVLSVPVAGETIGDAPWPRVHRFTIERRVIPDLNNPPGAPARWFLQFLDTVRLALGVKLNRFYFPMREGLRTQSYHLEIAGPAGTYLGGSEIIGPLGGEVDLDGMMDRRMGQRRAHAYTRRIRGNVVPHFATRFLERAPGSFGSATMVSGAATLVIWLLANRRIEDVATDSPWLLPGLLAVPVAAAALTGFERRDQRHPSLLSYFVQFATVGASLAAFAMATLGSSTDPNDDTAWALLAWTSTAITLISGYSWILRLAVENHFSRRTHSEYSG